MLQNSAERHGASYLRGLASAYVFPDELTNELTDADWGFRLSRLGVFVVLSQESGHKASNSLGGSLYPRLPRQPGRIYDRRYRAGFSV